MDKDKSFRQRLRMTLTLIGSDVLSYNTGEFWMIEREYRYVQGYALERRLFNTSVALPLVRALHNDDHRKGTVLKDGVAWRLPYVIHCLKVCRMLIDLRLPLEQEEEDIVLASALCHDLIEDIPFAEKGYELVTEFGLDERVYATVKRLSKRRDFTEEEEIAFFRAIAMDRRALLVKLADRGNNVEDLYNMKPEKVREYIGETRTFFFPMCRYGKAQYPEIRAEIEILNEKMISLTELAEILVDRYEEREAELEGQIQRLQVENGRLKAALEVLDV